MQANAFRAALPSVRAQGLGHLLCSSCHEVTPPRPVAQQLWLFGEGHLVTPCLSPAPFLTLASSYSRNLEDAYNVPPAASPPEMVLHSLVRVVRMSSTKTSYVLNLRTVFVSGLSYLNQFCTSAPCLCF